MKLISAKHYWTLVTMFKKYLFNDLIEAIKIIKNDIERKDNVWNFKQTKLQKNDYWIIRNIIEEEGYSNVKNKLEYIEINR